MEKITINVGGMSCGHCVQAVTNAVTALPGVGSVTVDLESGLVTAEHDPAVTSVDKIKAEIEEQGYDAL